VIKEVFSDEEFSSVRAADGGGGCQSESCNGEHSGAYNYYHYASSAAPGLLLK
jgi:hypothetical protein